MFIGYPSSLVIQKDKLALRCGDQNVQHAICININLEKKENNNQTIFTLSTFTLSQENKFESGFTKVYTVRYQ